jgi:hypothetical protein
LKELKGEERELQRGFASYQQRVEATPRREQEFQDLTRDYQSTRELYSTLLKRYEEAELAGNLEQRQKGEQFRIIDPAVPLSTPAAPRRRELLLVTLVAALGLAVGAVVAAESLDSAVHTIEELRREPNVPILGRIPTIVTRGDMLRARRRLALGVAATGCGLIALAVTSYLSATGRVPLISNVVFSALMRT